MEKKRGVPHLDTSKVPRNDRSGLLPKNTIILAMITL
jgi:hypothetical protein